MRQYSNRCSEVLLLEILISLAIISVVLAMGMLNYSTILVPNFQGPTRPSGPTLYQFVRRARGPSPSPRGPGQFIGTNQLQISELWIVGTPACWTSPSASRVAPIIVFSSIPDLRSPSILEILPPSTLGPPLAVHRSEFRRPVLSSMA